MRKIILAMLVIVGSISPAFAGKYFDYSGYAAYRYGGINRNQPQSQVLDFEPRKPAVPNPCGEAFRELTGTTKGVCKGGM